MQLLSKIAKNVLKWVFRPIRPFIIAYLDKFYYTKFPGYAEPSESMISSKASLQRPFSISQTTIGDFTYISANSMIGKTMIGKFCSIGPNFLCGWGIHPLDGLSTSPMFYSTKKQNGYTLCTVDKVEERKPIVIGNDVFIGANVTVLDGVLIGDGAVIGAGAVVSKNIPPYAIAVGCPIQVKRFRFSDQQIASLLDIRWWDFPDEKLREIERLFFDVDAFIDLNIKKMSDID